MRSYYPVLFYPKIIPDPALLEEEEDWIKSEGMERMGRV
jgi:hypothetical protein